MEPHRLFNKIVLLDDTGIQPEWLERLQELASDELVVFDSTPETEQEVIRRISNAQCVLVSWNTQITRSIIEACPNLKYIGLCCSLYSDKSSNVDIVAAREHHISVSGIFDYGDIGLVEFVIAELIRMMKGIGPRQWKEEPVELAGRKLGIFGMGTTGKLLATTAQSMGMDVSYYSRTRKPIAEQEGIKYRSLNNLLEEAEIVSLHLPKGQILLNDEAFQRLGDGKILINTSLGLTFDKQAFLGWIARGNNYAIFDGDGVGGNQEEFTAYPQIMTTPKVAGWTKEAKQRLSEKVLENLRSYSKQ